ncbi:hypothetical protein L873DRAFT_919218 [Choiromyces venosus 120613-1]|uniref:Uncharacterized protein n=1 Tax=Choiromyces venosus 120613-1 TaxID=1336337 RepID=A0A3N4JR70_9PEZI|nr:hypothetical protein L873DRAFT_919218 [Choiromyces venosus 120613-1]
MSMTECSPRTHSLFTIYTPNFSKVPLCSSSPPNSLYHKKDFSFSSPFLLTTTHAYHFNKPPIYPLDQRGKPKKKKNNTRNFSSSQFFERQRLSTMNNITNNTTILRGTLESPSTLFETFVTYVDQAVHHGAGAIDALKARFGVMMDNLNAGSYRLVRLRGTKNKNEHSREDQDTTTTTPTNEAANTLRKRAPRHILLPARRRSMRILESAKKSGQIVSKKDVAGGDQIAIKVKPPVLKPKSGAGVKKNKTVAGGLKRRIEAEIAVKVEHKNVDITTTTATWIKTQPPATPSAHPTSPEHEKMAINSTPSVITLKKSTTNKHQGKRTTRGILQAPRRKSMRIMESARKSAQENLVVGCTEAIVGRLSGQISAKERKRNSSILKPRSRAGIPKRGGRAHHSTVRRG